MADNTISVLIRAKDLASREFQKLERNINKLKQNNTSLSKSTGEASAGLEMMGKAAGVVSAAFAALEVGRFAIEVANLGESVRNTQNRFEDLVGGTVAAENALNRMRKATRGISDDASLMQGASDLLLMGIANTAEEATQIMELSIGLKRSTDSVADALNNFAIMLGNQSYLRLDSFGISAGRTRLRVEELLATAQAATREDAFRMAVLEIGQETLDRTAQSIDETSTAFKRAKADVTNAMQDIGQVVEQQANVVIGQFERMYATISGDDERLAMIEDMDRRIIRRAAENIEGALTPDMVRSIISATGLGIPEMFSAIDKQVGASGRTRLQDRTNLNQELIDGYRIYIGDLAEMLGVEVRVLEENADLVQEILEKRFSNETQALEKHQEEMALVRQQGLNEQQRIQNAGIQNEIANFRQAEQAFSRALLEGRIFDQEGRPTGFFDPAMYSQLDAAQTAMAQSADYLVTAYEAGGNITEKMANDFRQSANGAERTARQTWSMVEALNNADLSRLFGVTDVDKSLMELGSRVSSLLDQDTADSFTKAVERQAGARTGLQDYFEETVIPAIAEVVDQRGPEIGANLATQIEDALELGLRLGFTPEQMQTLFSELLQLPTGETEATTINVPFTPTWQDVSRVTGMGQTELATALGIEEGSITMGEAITVAIPNMSFGDLATSLGADPGSALRSNLQYLIFGENNAIQVTDDIKLNAASVSWGQIQDWTGMSFEQLIKSLPPEAIWGTGVSPTTTGIMPGQWQIGGIGTGMGPSMAGIGTSPFSGLDWSSPESVLQKIGPQSEMDALLTGASNLETSLTAIATKDMSTLNTAFVEVNSSLVDTNQQLERITSREWVIPLRFAADFGSFERNFSEWLNQQNQDNGGVSPGTIRQGRMG